MKKLSGLVALSLLFAVPALADAQTPGTTGTTLQYGNVTVTAPTPIKSTSASCPILGPFPAPVAANTPLCTITVLPVGWVGTVSNPAGGADSSKFQVVQNGTLLVLQNTVALPATGSAAGNGVYAVGSSAVVP